MAKVLVTGGSGFIGAHVLELLLERGYSVTTTVRSEAKAAQIRDAHPEIPASRLDFKIVEDIAQEGAFDEAVKIEGLEAVLHVASPFHFRVTDIKKDLLDPAIIGTAGILKAIKENAPTVKHVVITSSFAAIIDASKGVSWDHTYSEADWNPITPSLALSNPAHGYRGSKTFAERAAWEFVEKEKPGFCLSTVCPPVVLGPVVHFLATLEGINTSNERVRDFIEGRYKLKEEVAPTGNFIWADVRDLATAHVNAISTPAAAGKRFFVVNGHFSNNDIRDVIVKHFPEYAEKLPGKDVKGGEYPEAGLFKFDNSRSREVLGVTYRSLEESVVDTVKSLKTVGV